MNISLNSALDIRYQLSSFRCGNKTKKVDVHRFTSYYEKYFIRVVPEY